MTAFLTALENSGLSTWLRESNSIWAYPTVLTLHTIGLALLVGANAALDLRVLGVGKAIAVSDQRPLFRGMWIGVWVNAVPSSSLPTPRPRRRLRCSSSSSVWWRRESR